LRALRLLLRDGAAKSVVGGVGAADIGGAILDQIGAGVALDVQAAGAAVQAIEELQRGHLEVRCLQDRHAALASWRTA
jgi:hypothetical protein